MNTLLRRRLAPLAKLLILFCSAALLMGMGGGDENAAGSMPLPEKNFSVKMTDRSGLQTQSSKLTWEGKVHFRGKYGEATVNVPFAKIKNAAFQTMSSGEAEYSVASITLHSGQQIELALENQTSVYAETPFGELEISVADLRLLEFSE
jgi:S-adenosylmethionine hydrolase